MSDLLGGLRLAEGIRQRGDGTKTTNDFYVLALADEVISLRKYARKMEAKLSLYTFWTPQDPGTKEAMEYATGWACGPEKEPVANLVRAAHAIAHALRAAMVRLEEAEKGRDTLKTGCLRIFKLDPEKDSDGLGFNEWGEAFCFRMAKSMAWKLSQGVPLDEA